MWEIGVITVLGGTWYSVCARVSVLFMHIVWCPRCSFLCGYKRERERGREGGGSREERVQIKPSVMMKSFHVVFPSTTILISSPSLPNVTKKNFLMKVPQLPQNAGKLYLHGKCATPMHIQCTTGRFS